MGLNEGDVVFLSGSVPHRAGWERRPIQIEEAIVSVTRAVFARGGRLLFGGHPSVSPLVAAIAGEYFPPDRERQHRPVITFQSRYFEDRLPNETWDLHRMGWTSIEWTERVDDDEQGSLKLMRERMLDSPATPPRAMFAIGGMEGVIAEARMFQDVHHGKPIFAFTSTGAAAARVREAVPAAIDVEARFREEFGNLLPPDLPVPPYAAMAQWVLDSL
jgi:hypothetical protein